MPDDTPLDATALTRLERIGGSRLVVRVIDAFLESAPQRLARAREGLTVADASEVVAVLHSLVSSAGQLGARELERLAREGQPRIRAGGIEDAAAVLRDVEDAFDRLRPRLEAIRKDRTA